MTKNDRSAKLNALVAQEKTPGRVAITQTEYDAAIAAFQRGVSLDQIARVLASARGSAYSRLGTGALRFCMCYARRGR